MSNKLKLGEIATLITKGTTPTTLGYSFTDSGINFVKIESIDDFGLFIPEKFAHITEECNNALKRSKLAEDDILFSIAGAIGKTAIVTKDILPANTNQALAIIRIPKEKINLQFVLYALHSQSVVEQSEKQQQGVAQLNLSLKNISDIEIPAISAQEQEKIVENLAAVDELITSRRKQLLLFDELVKSRFIELFGNSNYPCEPLDNNVIEMFIGPFGSSLKNEFFVDEEDGFCMVYEQKHAIQKTMNVPTRYVPKSKYEELKRFTVVGGDIIVSCRGTIGEIFIIPEDAPMGIMHPSIMKIRLDTTKYNQKFFVFALEQYMDEHNAEAKGSGVKMAVSATVLGQADFVVPPIEIQNQFSTFVEQVDKSKYYNQKTINIEPKQI